MTPPPRPKIPISSQVQVFFRDGWLCSLCHRPTIFQLSLKYAAGLVHEKHYELPIAYFHPRWRRDASPLLDHLGCVIDHVLAHSRGGGHHLDNFAAACNKCNVRKSAAEKKRYLKENPPKRVKGKYGEPKHWDGLASLFVVLARDNPTQLTQNEREWLRALESHILQAKGIVSAGHLVTANAQRIKS
jgi:5-methylcytosine-specific restriction endonuclease McrA